MLYISFIYHNEVNKLISEVGPTKALVPPTELGGIALTDGEHTEVNMRTDKEYGPLMQEFLTGSSDIVVEDLAIANAIITGRMLAQFLIKIEKNKAVSNAVKGISYTPPEKKQLFGQVRDTICLKTLSLLCKGPKELDKACIFFRSPCFHNPKAKVGDINHEIPNDRTREEYLLRARTLKTLHDVLKERLEKNYRKDAIGVYLKGFRNTLAMNKSGVPINVERLNKEVSVAREKIKECEEFYKVRNLNKNTAKKFIDEHSGLPPLENRQKESLQEIIDKSDNAFARKAAECTMYTGLMSTKKLLKVHDFLHEDNTCKDAFVFCGASRTGRWTSIGPQFQNLTENIRELIEAPEGKHLYIADLKSIEPRVAFYLLNNKDTLERLRKGLDIYGDIPKVAFLAFLYGAGVDTVADYYFDEDKELVREYHALFKDRYPDVSKRHLDIQDRIISAYTEQEEFTYSMFGIKELSYGVPEIDTKQKHYQVHVYRDCYGKQQGLYGALVFQHVCQAFAHYIFLLKLNAFIAKGYDVRMVIHDEVVAVVDEHKDLLSIDKDFKESAEALIDNSFPGLPLEFKSVKRKTYGGSK